LNGLTSLFEHYPTSQSPSIFVTSWFSSLVISQIVQFLYFTLLFGVASSLYPDCWWMFRKENRSRFSRDALFLAIAIVTVAFGLSRISDGLVQRFHSAALLPTLAIPEELDHLVPAFSLMTRAVRSALVYTSMLAVIAYFLQNVIRKSYLRVLFLLLILISLLPADANSLGEWAFSLVNQTILLLIVVVVVRFFLRRNVPAYMSSLLLLSLFRSGLRVCLSSPLLLFAGMALPCW
jgi:hypothetical protein